MVYLSLLNFDAAHILSNTNSSQEVSKKALVISELVLRPSCAAVAPRSHALALQPLRRGESRHAMHGAEVHEPELSRVGQRREETRRDSLTSQGLAQGGSKYFYLDPKTSQAHLRR